MTWVVMKVGWVLQVLLGTTAAESMNASANIFLGQVFTIFLIHRCSTAPLIFDKLSELYNNYVDGSSYSNQTFFG